MHDVLTLGSATFDVFLTSADFKVVDMKDFPSGKGECFSFGSKIDIHDMVTSSGGGATNAAATFTNLGLNAQVISRIGTDAAGEMVLRDLQARGIGTKYLHRTEKEKTAYATILSRPHSDRTILVYRGTSEHFQTSDLPSRLKAHWIYVTSLGGNLAVARAAFERALNTQTDIFWNPGAGELEQGLKKLQSLLRHVTILNLNDEEASLLTHLPIARKNETIQILLGTGVQQVLLTHGSEGATYADVTKQFFAPGLKVRVANLTGAGDAFGSGFVSGFIKTRNVETALRVAILNSSSVIQKIGAKNGLLEKFPAHTALDKIKIRRV